MEFWDIIDNLSDLSQFPKEWNYCINWIFFIQLIVAIGSCYINNNMWPSKKVKQSIAVTQVKTMLIVQIIYFYWEITFTRMFSNNFIILIHHVIFMIHSAFLLHWTDSICGYTLLPYLFYSVTWVFGNENNKIFFIMFQIECFIYIFHTLYGYILPKFLNIGFPIFALLLTSTNYILYCWDYDGKFCPSEKVIFIFNTDLSIFFFISYLIIIIIVYLITVLPFFKILKKLEKAQLNNITIEDSIEGSRENSSSNNTNLFNNNINNNIIGNKKDK